MAKVGANPEAMDNMIRILTKFIALQDSVVENLKTQYTNVGEEWDDQKYEELGNVIDDATTAIKGSYATLSACISRIQVLKTILENYIHTNLG